ncbi:hypothetical protein [Mesorhizobium sp. J428]|uniref:hypothetical protein n=1 Tax=Mesorhizobium sp. J428 TaxID=2898440 RepID=UPI002151347E|nr:hypothetical protein [Mesorhizobium sp. J428]MCR5858501.1 hypothetical protein [Mesorhizobium sp. J428]
MTTEESKVSKVLDLLKQGSPDTFQQRFRSAERLMFDERGDDTAFLCRLLARAIASDEEFPNADTLLERAVCRVSENELRLLADMILKSGKHIEDLYGLPAVVASQIPEAFPIEVLLQLYDYRGWFQSTNPLAIQRAWHLVFADPLTFAADIPTHGEHPTWRLPATGETFLVGGKSSAHCTSCGHPRGTSGHS